MNPGDASLYVLLTVLIVFIVIEVWLLAQLAIEVVLGWWRRDMRGYARWKKYEPMARYLAGVLLGVWIGWGLAMMQVEG